MPKKQSESSFYGHEADEEKVKSFDLDKHMISLIWNEPFFSEIMRSITKIKTDEISTAGVTVQDGTLLFMWNPKFLAGLNESQIRGLIKHECYHLIFKHTTIRRHDPHIIWNYATDLAINSIIPESELPEGGLIPGKAFKRPDPEVWNSMTQEQQHRFTTISNKIASLPKRESSEWYFAELMNDPEVSESIKKQHGKIKVKLVPGGSGKGDGEEVVIDIGGMDDHEGWDELSDEEKALTDGKVEGILREAIERCDNNNNWGNVSQSTRKKLREIISKEVDWRSLLRNFCGRSQRAQKSSSVKRINRKYPYVHPGKKRQHSSNIAVYVDMSGSVSDESLNLLYAELTNLAKRTTFTFFPFDCSVDTKSSFVWKKNKKVEAKRYRSGGTCFHAVTKHAGDNKKIFDGYIILTDGYAPLPPKNLLRRAWIITPCGDQGFSCGTDPIIKIKS